MPNSLPSVFQIWHDSLYRLRSYCWETARRSIRPNFSVHPVGKTMGWIEKWMAPFLMGTTSSITTQSLQKIVLRAPAVGAKMSCLFFFFFICHAQNPEHRAFEGCIVRTSIALPFIARFRRGFQRYFHKGLLFQKHYLVRTFVARWRHNNREIAVKIAKSPKIGGKVCAHHFI